MSVHFCRLVPLSVTNNSVGSRTATAAAPTLPTAAVHDLTLFFITETGKSISEQKCAAHYKNECNNILSLFRTS